MYHAALQRTKAVRASLHAVIDLSRLEGAEEAYKRCYEDLSKLSETRYDYILRAVDSLREETRALPENPGLEMADLHPHSTIWVQFKDNVIQVN